MEGGSSTTTTVITLILSTLFCSLSLNSRAATDILRTDQNITDGSTIVSAGGQFELGFLSLGTSVNRYVGIWYKQISVKTTVWIANRGTPLHTTTGLLKLNTNGDLVILDGSGYVVWSSNSSKFVSKPVLQLLDRGNLVIYNETDGNVQKNYVWQSFNEPGDTFLPGNNLGWDLETGMETYLSSWRSEDDPSPGEFTYHVNRIGFPQLILRKGSDITFREGPLDNFGSTGLFKTTPVYVSYVVFNDKELHYHYELVDSIVTRLVLHPLGDIGRWIWVERIKVWQLYRSHQTDDCDTYELCGAYGFCNVARSPACECLNEFQPKFPEGWNAGDWSGGCVRKVELSCTGADVFVNYSGVKLPDTQKSWFDTKMSLDKCNKLCLENCSCTAYANIESGSGCLLWFNELIDIRNYEEGGQDIYIRRAALEPVLPKDEARKGKSKVKFMIIPILLTATMMLGVCLWVIRKKKKQRTEELAKLHFANDEENGNGDEDLELPLFDFTTLATATNGFSSNSKLGEGGFGPVYKGTLDEGKDIAVKRLSKDSRQGLKEFKNEVSCIARLQHRNLVKLLGCSVQEGERMLVYEYMPNKSLDSFIFDKNQSKALAWTMRYNIINGIARGILYLHQDSRLRIIHRDLKASNILLDHEMNPKISDFGTARICGETETGASTTRVVGTYGYMSPEYATDGIFSVKSDVYSFGVMLLEIVSGKRNKNFTHRDHNLNLLGHAWGTFTDGNVLDLVDEVIADLSHQHQLEVFRAIQIGLLCVQQYPADRPTMANVVLMLTSENALPQPKQPGFYTERKLHEEDSSAHSSNNLSVTTMAPR